MASITYFSDIQNKPVLDDHGKPVGILADLLFRDGEETAQITHLVLKLKPLNAHLLKVDWKFVSSVGNSIHLNAVKEKIGVDELDETDSSVNELLMDRQLIDVDGLKVIRVNDVLLTKTGKKFVISSVAVGTRSLLRRLGLEKIVQILIPKLPQRLVPWQYVQPLAENSQSLGLKFSRSKINEVHPADIADLLEELTYSERQIIFSALDTETAAETLAESTPKLQASLVEHLQENRIHSILKRLSPSEIVDLFGSVSNASKSKLFGIIEQLDTKLFKKIERLMPYPEEWAGGLMKTEYFSIPENFTVAQTKRYLKKQPDIEDFHHIYLVDSDKKLVGAVLLKDLFLHSPKTKVKEFMDSNVIYVHLKDPLKKVSQTFSKYHAFALPVVDKKERLAGIISMNDVFEEISPKQWSKIPFFARRTQSDKSSHEKNAGEKQEK